MLYSPRHNDCRAGQDRTRFLLNPTNVSPQFMTRRIAPAPCCRLRLPSPRNANSTLTLLSCTVHSSGVRTTDRAAIATDVQSWRLHLALRLAPAASRKYLDSPKLQIPLPRRLR